MAKLNVKSSVYTENDRVGFFNPTVLGRLYRCPSCSLPAFRVTNVQTSLSVLRFYIFGSYIAHKFMYVR